MACAQNFAPWQQATIERSCSQSLLLLLARATYIMVLFFTHLPFVVNCTINATPPKRLQQHSLLFTMNRPDRTFFVWRLNSARPPHLGHSIISLQSEILSGMCAMLRTVAPSNNKDHARNLIIYFYSSHTSCSWWITHSAQHHQKGCNTIICKQW